MMMRRRRGAEEESGRGAEGLAHLQPRDASLLQEILPYEEGERERDDNLKHAAHREEERAQIESDVEEDEGE